MVQVGTVQHDLVVDYLPYKRGVPAAHVVVHPPVAGFWLWTLFNLAMAVLLALDIRAGSAASRGASRDGNDAVGRSASTLKRAIAWSAVWVGAAFAFGAWLAIFRGAAVGNTFIAGYLVEESLSVDNLLVIMLIFKSFKIKPARQGRILKWGIIGAIVMRGVFIFAGMALLDRFAPTVYLFALALFYAAYISYKEGLHALKKSRKKRAGGSGKSGNAAAWELARARSPPNAFTPIGGSFSSFGSSGGGDIANGLRQRGGGGGASLAAGGMGSIGMRHVSLSPVRIGSSAEDSDDEAEDHTQGWLMSMLTRVIPFAREYDGQAFFTRRLSDNVLQATPLFAALVVVEASDVIFAVDSIPCILGLTHDLFIAYSSNMLAVLGLRSLYLLLADTLDHFEHLQLGLSVILAFVGAKMMLNQVVELPNWLSLAVIISVLAVTMSLGGTKEGGDGKKGHGGGGGGGAVFGKATSGGSTASGLLG